MMIVKILLMIIFGLMSTTLYNMNEECNKTTKGSIIILIVIIILIFLGLSIGINI